MVTYIPTEWTIIENKFTPRSNSSSGYGNKLPTRFTCFDGSRIRRVYAICYSNAASFYVNVKGSRWFIPGYRF